VVAISAAATTHFSVNTLVFYPCTISVSVSGTSAVACAAQSPLITYDSHSGSSDMIMTVEF